jgi:hypothetical protein
MSIWVGFSPGSRGRFESLSTVSLTVFHSDHLAGAPDAASRY